MVWATDIERWLVGKSVCYVLFWGFEWENYMTKSGFYGISWEITQQNGQFVIFWSGTSTKLGEIISIATNAGSPALMLN